MINRKSLDRNILLIVLSFIFLSACSGNNIPDAKTGNTTGIDKPTVAPAKRGKTIDRENSLTKPLTLAESNIPGRVKYISYRRYGVRAWRGTIVKKFLAARGYYAYDAAGNLLAHNEYKPDGSELIGCVYNYDKQSRAIEWDIMDGSIDRDSKIVFRYDDKGYKIEQLTDDKDPKFSMKATFKYDDKGNEIQENDYAEGNKLKRLVISKYDGKGNQTVLAYKSPDQAVQGKVTCTYDDSGNEVAGKKYSSDTDVVMKWVCKNDDKGKCIEKAYYSPYGKVILRNTYKYDAHGNVLEFNYYEANSSLNAEGSYSLEYVYDKTGNIVRQTKFIMRSGRKTPVELLESDVQYY